MPFIWFTSAIGYPEFYDGSPNGLALGEAFKTFAEAAKNRLTYEEAKGLFDQSEHQVETKKAAFQEFGLLYVVPRSNRVSLTPLGAQVAQLISEAPDDKRNRWQVAVALAYGLSRYQFNNPLPVGGNKGRARAESSDLRPYLVAFYMLHRLNGVLTSTELFGGLFGVQNGDEVEAMIKTILRARSRKAPLPPLPDLPANPRTQENLKIYLMSHLGLGSQILTRFEDESLYGEAQQTFELTQRGYEITAAILDLEWRRWKAHGEPPSASEFVDETTYFTAGVGRRCPAALFESLGHEVASEPILAEEAPSLDDLRSLRHREFEEGRRRLIEHVKLERQRNPTLVKHAKRTFLERNGRLYCEACGFDFSERYGERGSGFIEAHHRTPLSRIDPDAPAIAVTIADLAMVCANCHRMLHRLPWITVDELRRILED
jgi:hypothetical protein